MNSCLTCVHRPDYVMAFCLSEFNKSAGCLTWLMLTAAASALAILIFHAPKRVKNVFYYQILNSYVLLITCAASIFQRDITRLHASVAIFLATSPVLIYFLVYSIRAFWGQHQLDNVLGKEHYLNRGLVFFAVGMWICILAFTSLDSTRAHFVMGICYYVLTVPDMFGGAIMYFLLFTAGTTVGLWPVSIVVARKEIWPPGEGYRPKFATVW
jgi:hypothetical protein